MISAIKVTSILFKHLDNLSHIAEKARWPGGIPYRGTGQALG